MARNGMVRRQLGAAAVAVTSRGLSQVSGIPRVGLPSVGTANEITGDAGVVVVVIVALSGPAVPARR